ncbi:hypothetical protein LTR67_004310 [Exophiala xenobiotica]
MDKRRTCGNCFKHLFAVIVVCNEGNKVKNLNSQVHLAVAKLFAPTVWIQSATPALNAPVDLTGYLALWWRDEYSEDINNFELPEDERMYTDAIWAKVQKKCPNYAEKHGEPLYTLNYSSAQDAEGRDTEDTDGDPLVWANQFKGLFVHAVCDEGHKIKNPRTRVHLTIQTLFARLNWIVTATPMINRVSDLLGYLNIFWRPNWVDDLDTLDDYQLPGDYKDRYKESLLDSIDTECPQYAARYANMPMFIFDPRAFATLNTKDLLDGGATTKAVQLWQKSWF